jgi:hypothetical protein
MKKSLIVLYLINLVPRNNLKDSTIFGRINSNIKNFTWSKCLNYPQIDDRIRYCHVLFYSKSELENCRNNFCHSCCLKTVDLTNKGHLSLCKKQCSTIEEGSNNKTWKSCIEPTHTENSIYPYCDEHFKKDFYGRSRCKTDLCNLCCVSVESMKKNTLLSDFSVSKCYEKCVKSKNFYLIF